MTHISFSSCEGLNVIKLIAALKPCPYDLITCSFRKIGFKDSVDGYSYFYQSINNGDTSDKAMGEQLKFPALGFAARHKDLLNLVGTAISKLNLHLKK